MAEYSEEYVKMLEQRIEKQKEMLVLAGKMSTAARSIVGGQDITVGVHMAADVFNIGSLCNKLKEAVDKYDFLILSS